MFEEGRPASNTYHQNQNTVHTVVVQYTYKIGNKDYMSEIRKLQQNEYEKWDLDVESKEWTHESITENVVNGEKQLMHDAIQAKKIEQKENSTQEERDRMERERSAKIFIIKHPTVASYVMELENKLKLSEEKVSKLKKALNDLEKSYAYYRRQDREQQQKEKELNAQISKLNQEIKRYRAKWISPLINDSKPIPEESLLILMTKLKSISETDDDDLPMHHL